MRAKMGPGGYKQSGMSVGGMGATPNTGGDTGNPMDDAGNTEGDDTQTSGGDINTACFPLSALSESTSSDGAPPAVGDTVSFSAEGKVNKVDGTNVWIDLDTIDGNSVGDEGDDNNPATMPMDKLKAKLGARSSAADAGSGY